METILFLIKSAILGIVEGITEFLPISSTGHLIIAEKLLAFSGPSPNYVEMFTYVIQLGAILAIVLLYWKKIKDTLIHFFPKKVGFERSGFKFWLMIGIACIPGAVIGIALDDIADRYLFNPYTVAITLFVGGFLMIWAEKRFRSNRVGADLSVSPKQAIVIGAFQCLAIIPGMSRSASTIIGGWVAGLSTVAAAEFSFFLAIPVMIGMSALKLIKIGGLTSMTSLEMYGLGLGFFVSFLVALFVVDRFIAFLKKRPMKYFAFYRIGFALLVLLAGYFGLF